MQGRVMGVDRNGENIIVALFTVVLLAFLGVEFACPAQAENTE